MANVLIVSSDYYSSQSLADTLEKHGVTASCIYRDYHFDNTLQGVDVVVTDGTCKTRPRMGSRTRSGSPRRARQPSTSAYRS